MAGFEEKVLATFLQTQCSSFELPHQPNKLVVDNGKGIDLLGGIDLHIRLAN